ncbi:hypothetical protein OPQ81_003869 [Rhizoctonia solani]|nr:hypothetical protein OPQ81_003869 [Rhizoctonia solani]
MDTRGFRSHPTQTIAYSPIPNVPLRSLLTSLSHSYLQNLRAPVGRQHVTVQQLDPSAMQLVKNVDDILDECWKMLTGMKSRLPASEFDHIESRHNQLYLTVVDVKSDIRGRQQKHVFFASPAERELFLIRMRKLLGQCEIHHTDVLSASRRAHLQAGHQAVESTSNLPTPVSASPGDSQPEWLSIVSEYDTSLDSSEDEVDTSSLSQSGSESSGDSQRFIATVAHIPRSALATEEGLGSQLPDDDSYYRILICGNKRKRAIVVDPKPHPISAKHGDKDAEHSQDEILQVGDMLMKGNPKQLEGHQVVHSYRGPSFISSFISSWNYGSLPLGGML